MFSSLGQPIRLCRLLFSVEDYNSGYPQFSALVAAHNSFHLCRRFSNLRARLLLLKRDRLCLLEKQLERIDREETAVLFLRSSRCDSDMERKSVLSDIDTALADYGVAVSLSIERQPPFNKDIDALVEKKSSNARF